MVTDASLYGWGALLFDEREGTVIQAQGAWGKTFRSHDINYLEMRAVHEALAQFAEQIAKRPLDTMLVLVDNTSTRDVLVKGHAREYLFNGELAKALKRLAGDRRVITAHIPTEENPTDVLSRNGLKYSEQELDSLQSTLGALGGRLARSALPVRVPAARGFVGNPTFVLPTGNTNTKQTGGVRAPIAGTQIARVVRGCERGNAPS